jgi:hypothetical protein
MQEILIQMRFKIPIRFDAHWRDGPRMIKTYYDLGHDGRIDGKESYTFLPELRVSPVTFGKLGVHY